MNYKYVSLDRIFSKVIRDVKSEFSESDIVEWCGEALEFIGATKLYEEAVAFIEVKNHQCQLPGRLHAVIQVARNNSWSAPTSDALCPVKIQEEVAASSETPPASVPVALDCNGQPLNEYEVAYYRPYFDFKWGYNVWSNTSTYKQKYTPVRLATNSFFNSLVCTEVQNGTENIYRSTLDEYTIVNGDILRFSFREGSVAVAYLRQVMDEVTGYPMVPDNISYTTAIVKYITLKMFEREFYNGREGAERKMNKAEQDWHWYCKQASNVDLMPYGVDEHQNLLDQRSYLLPRQGQYFGFFGNLARPEHRTWNYRYGSRSTGYPGAVGGVAVSPEGASEGMVISNTVVSDMGNLAQDQW